ncbi:threonine aldolase family protein [Marinilabilia rubra]|uniref:Threonine aldolase n=1 Tax=Marinilabilia rubra TaxID=2162893 RepID=A0A2U2BAP0_9BACT|nr:low specificity L-threonine aldolase [Marinilabilia rubra]PWE00130.1 threonine aldolase [Marinilabilia rubra]
MKGFASDNNSGVHPDVMESVIKANKEHAVGYGGDELTAKAEQLFQKTFGPGARVFFVYNGTGANVIALQAMANPFNAVIAAQTAHINVDECGAPEKHTGCKMLTVDTPDGKLKPELIQQHLHGFGFEHHSQPGVVSITQVTEMGTLYSLEELKKIADFVHSRGLYLHMDGARISNAAAALGCSFKEMTTDVGVDVLSFGGTKNGLMFGEAVVFLNPDLGANAKYIRKQTTQLHSKMRFIAAQFVTFLSDDLWYRNAHHANKMAALLAEKLEPVKRIKITQKVEANGVFAILPPHIIEPLQESYFFYMWDESRHEVRWMTSFDTTEEEINSFVEAIKRLV